MFEEWLGEDWKLVSTPDIKADYGGFHVYAFTMTLGMVFAILYSIYKFRKKGLSLSAIAIGTVFIIPASLFGASFFGKLNYDHKGIEDFVGFLKLFAFWDGGMSIHGGVYGGIIVGLPVLFFIGRKTKVSLLTYTDAILPNVLLGQIIGRWGNFFNHELTGPKWFQVGMLTGSSGGETVDISQISIDHYQYLYDGPFGWLFKNTLAMDKSTGEVWQMQPIFLIESLALLLVWIIITFIIPNIGKWLGPKPAKKHPGQYVINWGFTCLHFIAPWLKSDTKKTFSQVWDNAYYKNVNEKAKEGFILTSQAIQESSASKLQKRWKTNTALIKANNPDKYWIPKVGMEAFAFIFGWNVVRFVLEMSRSQDGLFVMYNMPLSLTLIGLSALIGLLGMIITQIGVPQLFRRTGYIYEKEYFLINAPTNIVLKTETTISDKNKLKQEKAKAKLEKLEAKNK
ncbi:prolipoprotein diacylglyceryl transferase family protein [Williamsoniiplasma lucivorax]|uniref:Prolipoprotein diacylglyceryl transferase n=1 Tax=Williamsoniiplasma lucivorax TaxID=209274 RepID=A0A2S5REU9_9MOLU|nr:prolipoprotein diacylglyceryl transferase family protein [Williamsoniiplasma lucivorax]PPE05818.1 prolipoprotein diacylglyceryl transferase [Williamsoniiplasma lucivorax]